LIMLDQMDVIKDDRLDIEFPDTWFWSRDNAYKSDCASAWQRRNQILFPDDEIF